MIRNMIQTCFLLAILLGISLRLGSGPAAAQTLPSDCMMSFNVKPTAGIVHYGWLPGGDTYTSRLSCTQAELLRERMFTPSIPGGITEADMAAAMQQPDPRKDALSALAAARAKAGGSPPNAFRLWLDAQLLAISQKQLIYCMVYAEGWGTAICGLGAIAFVVSGYDLLEKIGLTGGTETDKTALIALIDRATADVSKVPAGKLTPVPLDVARKYLMDAQIGLCREIKANCL